MILGAALLVLVALGLFVAGIATGGTALYWACVAVSATAAVLLVLARRQVARPAVPERATTATTATTAAAARRVVADTAADDEEAGDPPPDDDGADTATATAADTRSGTDGPAGQPPAHRMVDAEGDEPPAEEVEVTDLLLVMDIHDEVLVVDEHPRYHLADCAWLGSRTAIPLPVGLPVNEARTDGFTPCGMCAPDRHLAAAERERRARKGAT